MTVFETVGRGSIPWKGAFDGGATTSFIAGSSNGRTRHSECRCAGSNPALAVLLSLTEVIRLDEELVLKTGACQSVVSSSLTTSAVSKLGSHPAG